MRHSQHQTQHLILMIITIGITVISTSTSPGHWENSLTDVCGCRAHSRFAINIGFPPPITTFFPPRNPHEYFKARGQWPRDAPPASSTLA